LSRDSSVPSQYVIMSHMNCRTTPYQPFPLTLTFLRVLSLVWCSCTALVTTSTRRASFNSRRISSLFPQMPGVETSLTNRRREEPSSVLHPVGQYRPMVAVTADAKWHSSNSHTSRDSSRITGMASVLMYAIPPSAADPDPSPLANFHMVWPVSWRTLWTLSWDDSMRLSRSTAPSAPLRSM